MIIPSLKQIRSNVLYYTFKRDAIALPLNSISLISIVINFNLHLLFPSIWLTLIIHIHISGYMDKSKVISALDALAQENRMDIFHLLVEKGPEGYMVGTIGEILNLPHATLSFHLDKLKQSQLISSTKQGRATIYSVNYNVFIDSIRYLINNCCKESDMNCTVVIEEKNTYC